jgi:ABC-2 type transport system ATP-binding protein
MNPTNPIPEPEIRIERLTKRYGDRTAVDELNLSLWPGTLFGLLGRNGAGKTTTIHTIMGLRNPTSGKVRIRGSDVTERDVHRVRRAIGFLPEEPVLYPHLTGREFLTFVGTLHEVPNLGERVGPGLERLELAGQADAPIWTYSQGMRKKLAFLAATLHEPVILILDEPTGSMDAVGAREVKRMMREYRDRGALVLFTTHVMEIAERLADRVALLRSGTLVFEGTLAEFRVRTDADASETFEDLFIRWTESSAPGGVVPARHPSRGEGP